MLNRTLLVVFCFVIGNFEKIRTESYNQELDCLENLRDNNRFSMASYRLCKLIDKETDPCDDFYRFACGRYIDTKSEIFNVDYHSMSLDMIQRNKKFLINFWNRSNYSNSYAFDTYLTIKLFKSCINRGQLGLQPVQTVLDTYGGWPVAIGREYGFLEEDIKYRLLSIEPIVKLSFMQRNEVDPDRLYLATPSFDFFSDLLITKSDPYFELMVEVAVRFGAERFFAMDEMRKVLSFEQELFMNIGEEYLLKSTYEVESIRSQFPNVLMLIEPSIMDRNESLDVDTLSIETTSIHFIIFLEELLLKTEKQTVTNYLIWRIILKTSEFLTPDLSELVDDSLSTLMVRERKKSISQTESCFNYVQELLPFSLENVFIEQQKKFESYSVLEIFNEILEIYIEMVVNANWIEFETKNKIIYKLNTMEPLIGVLKKNRKERDTLAAYNIKLDSNDFIQNVLKIRQYYQGVPDMELPAWTVDGMYIPCDNTVYLTLGMLSWPYFSSDAPLYSKFGALGSTIALYIAEAIDPKNYKLEDDGTESSWSRSAEDKYINKANCFYQQYNAMETETGEKLNASKTTKKDVSENFGLKAAYRAYSRRLKANEQVPGLWNYTNRQLFWISMAQTHCGFNNPPTSKYTPIPHRVWGMIRNMPDFGNDFKCHPESKMYSKIYERCELL